MPRAPAPRIELYDATLRDGMGGGGMSLTAAEKLRVVRKLDELGVAMIEAGFPASNPKERELFELLAAERLKRAQVVAFGMTRRRATKAQADEGLRTLASCFAPACTLVGKSSVLHVEKVVRVSRKENLAMIADSVAFLARRGKRVLFDAEHFFDGFALDAAYALDTLRAASAAGAERVVLCDTNGGSLPAGVWQAVARVRKELPDVAIGIHTHDDSGCAVANSLIAIEAGATQVQGTINGIGERTGNANLVTIIADLELKLGRRVLPRGHLRRLTETAHFVDELLNRAPDPKQPYVGRHAFAHKAGLHASGVGADPGTFEHVAPDVVGNTRELIVSELAGKATVKQRAAEAGLELDDRAAARTAERIKELEHSGFQFEAADGSFELLARREAGAYEPLFRLESWRVIVEKAADGKVATEATIKIWVPGPPPPEPAALQARSSAQRATGPVGRTGTSPNGRARTPAARAVGAGAAGEGRAGERRLVRTAEGNGPVNALDNALRAAIGAVHPHLREIDLVNYKVRILDEAKGTGAITRVLIDASDGQRVWGAIGVSENLISASWDALVDSLEYGMLVGARQQPPRGAREPRGRGRASAPGSAGTAGRARTSRTSARR